MQQDTAAAEDTQPHVLARSEQLAQMRRDLDDAVDLFNWQLRCNAKLKGLLYACQAEGRAPRLDEIATAMAYEEQRKAA